MKQSPKESDRAVNVAAGHSTVSAPRIALVAASWHGEIVDQAVKACKAELKKNLGSAMRLRTFHVPGSLEIPLFCQRVAEIGHVDAIIAFGFIVNGGIYRHEFVASTVLDELIKASRETRVPIFSAVLTPINFQEHEAHTQFFLRHMQLKGVEVARSCLAMLRALRELDQIKSF